MLQPAKIRQVLEVENVTVAARIAGAQRRNTDAEIADIPRRGSEINLLAKREPLAILVMTGEPEIVIQFLELHAAHVSEAMSEDFLAGTIQEENASAQVRGDQTAAHGGNDVFGEILKPHNFSAFLFQLHPLSPTHPD